PALKDFTHIAKISCDKLDFLRSIDAVLRGDIVSLEERLKVAEEYTYQSRTDKMMRIIEGN
ncbi:hypothetical protein RNP85_26030, partial [Escherichia coli]|nr:hypothetical protein [Escherichia coli]